MPTMVNVYNIVCNPVCEFRVFMSQNVTFLSLCSLIQVYSKNGSNVTVTSQIISWGFIQLMSIF